MPLIVNNALVHRQEDFGLVADEIELLWRMEDHHFWHRARNRWILRALSAAGVAPPATVLEVGCGSGAVIRTLVRAGYRTTGIDTSAPLVEKAHQRCEEATLVVGDIASLEAPPFDAIGLFDVLEHLDDPAGMLNACRRLARPGTVFAATVPAQMALHTVIDDLSGHKKRYETGELAALFSSVGLTDVRERGIFRCTVPMQKAVRRGAQNRDASSLNADEKRVLWTRNFRIPFLPLNLALQLACAIECSFFFSGALNRSGASLLATARVP